MTPKNRHALLGGWLAAIVLPLAYAQTSTLSADSPDKDTVQLSPFEVRATDDAGYVGQETLSGSRVRTSLKDLAAAISPMTAEFLKDIAATSIAEAVDYGLGARVQTDDSRVVGEVYNDGFPSFRIRGLPGASRTVNFFPIGGEVDLYMIEQLEFSRGPNSILFGFGSPAGRVNASTKQARLNKNRYSLSARFDDWGGQRYAADANLVLLKDKLALRVALLNAREESWRAAGYNDQDRIFVTAKWQPDRKTTLRFDFERGLVSRFNPRPNYGFDFHTLWEQNGKPLFNNFSTSYVPGTFPGTANTPGTPILPPNNPAWQNRSGAAWVAVSPDYQYAQNFFRFATSRFDFFNNFPIMDLAMGRANPEAVLESNWVNGKFSSGFGTLTLQRELVPGLNAELSLNRTIFRTDVRNLATFNLLGVAIDPNIYQPNGLIKPVDHLYYFDASQYHLYGTNQTNQGRLSLSYEKKIRDLATLRLGVLGEMSYQKGRSQMKQQYWLKGPDDNSGGVFNATPENGANLAYQRFYVDPSKLLDPDFRIPAPMDLSGATQYQDPKTGAVSNIYMREINRLQANTNAQDNANVAGMAVAQLYLFKNRFVGTAGFRRDRAKSWIGISARDPVGEAIAPGQGTWMLVDPRGAGITPTISNGQTNTIGGVFHVTRWLSAFYNTSSSTSIPINRFITPADPTVTAPILTPQASGDTKDYGLKLNILGERLFVTATKYHTISKDESGFALFGARNTVISIWQALKDSNALGAADLDTATNQLASMQRIAGYVQDSETRGFELEIVGRPLPGWSVSVNYSKIDAARTNIANEFLNYVDHWKPLWLNYKNLSLPQNTTLARPQLAPSFTDFRTPADIQATGDFTINTDSINEAIVDAEAGFFDGLTVFDGKRSVGDARHNVNLRTRYDFRSGRLKGLSVGAGVRFRVDRMAGVRSDWTLPDSPNAYVERTNGRVVTSLTELTVPDQKVYDAQITYTRMLRKGKVRWDIQLNVSNLTDQSELITNYVDPRTLRPIGYYYQDPRRFILTNTFSF